VNCFIHDRSPAVGLCTVCQKAVCRACIARESPRLVCTTCVERRAILGFEYRSAASIGSWPLLHVCLGIDPVTMRPRVARGVMAIGNVAVGGVALGGLACGLASIGGLSIGLLGALGGAALGCGLSVGGLAVGSIAIGGLAIGFMHAIGGAAFAPSVISARQCDAETVDLLRRWIGPGIVLRNCR
jgi:hypothetical protein